MPAQCMRLTGEWLVDTDLLVPRRHPPSLRGKGAGGLGRPGTGRSMVNRYVKSPDELARIQSLFAEPVFSDSRELYAEPKKLADVRLERAGDLITGTVTRYGITFLELRGRMEETLPGGSATGATFHYKFTPSPDGRGLDADPALVHIRG